MNRQIDRVVKSVTDRGRAFIPQVMEDCQMNRDRTKRVLQKAVELGYLRSVGREMAEDGHLRAVYEPTGIWGGDEDALVWRGPRVASVWDLGARACA
jgi:hypothetical protein